MKKVDHSAFSQILSSDDSRDVDAIDNYGQTALFFIFSLSSEPCVKLLTKVGANLMVGERRNGSDGGGGRCFTRILW